MFLVVSQSDNNLKKHYNSPWPEGALHVCFETRLEQDRSTNTLQSTPQELELDGAVVFLGINSIHRRLPASGREHRSTVIDPERNAVRTAGRLERPQTGKQGERRLL